jgi:hypothetical protein
LPPLETPPSGAASLHRALFSKESRGLPAFYSSSHGFSLPATEKCNEVASVFVITIAKSEMEFF